MTEQADIVTCKFPGCQNPPEPATDRPGRPPGYCADKAHNATTAWRERKRIAAAERGTTTNEAETDQPVTMARLTGAELLRQMRALADTLTATAGAADKHRGRSWRHRRGGGRGGGRTEGG